VLSTVPYTAVSDWMIFGDSITVAGYKQLAADKPGWRLAVNARSGRGTADAVNQALAAPYLPPHVVMAVGANDVMNPPVMAAQIRRLRDALEPRGIQVYWVTAHVVRTRGTAAQQLADQRNSGWVNAQIQAGCVAPCKVIDWASFLAAYPSYRIPNYLRDGVHPSALGVPAWAALISGAVK
jgi:lysophospholipase L1-like esterase